MGVVRKNLRLRQVRMGLAYSFGLALVILFIGGAGFWVIDPTVATLQDGLWLAFTTASTVGFGDMVPTTHASRAFAVVVVILGLAVLSLVTASLSALFVEQDVVEDVVAEERIIEREIRAELKQMRAELRHMREALAASEASKNAPSDTPDQAHILQNKQD